MPKKKVVKKATPTVASEKTYRFTLADYEAWKIAGTNTGISKDFPEWLEEQAK